MAVKAVCKITGGFFVSIFQINISQTVLKQKIKNRVLQ